MVKIAKEADTVQLICWCDDANCANFIRMGVQPGSEEQLPVWQAFTGEVQRQGWFLRWDKHL